MRGVYFNVENVYNEFDPKNPKANSIVQLASDLSDHIHINLKKKFLWVPYLKLNGVVPERLAIITSLDIFGFILLQPMYYFPRNNQITENLDCVYWSVRNNAISDKKGVPLVKREHFLTKIGIQMEIDKNAASPGVQREIFRICSPLYTAKTSQLYL